MHHIYTKQKTLHFLPQWTELGAVHCSYRLLKSTFLSAQIFSV